MDDSVERKSETATGHHSELIARTYDLKILFILLPVFAFVYFVRASLAVALGDYSAAGLLAAAGITFACLRLFPQLIQGIPSAALFIILAAITVEGSLVYLNFVHVTHYLLHVTVLIMTATLTSGFLSGCIVAVASTAMGAWLLTTLPPTVIANIPEENFYPFSYWSLAHLLGTQAAGVLTILVVNKVLAKKEEEIHASKIEQAKLERRQHLSAQFGEIAHEINNSLAVINGAFHLYKLYCHAGKTESTSIVLNQMVESEVRLQTFIVQVHELVNKESAHD